MDIREFSRNLLALYEEISSTFNAYQRSSKLPCIQGCGKCCLNPEIEASTWEMIPLALKLYDEGLAEKYLDELNLQIPQTCILHVKTNEFGAGFCGQYLSRPSVCRMFGASGYHDKHGALELAICKYIKEENSDEAISAQNNIQTSPPPFINEYAYRLMQLHPELITQKKPINLAIKEALERILMLLSYQALE
jgi:Fe-S-cluster containining protein